MKKTIFIVIALAILLVVWILYRETQSFFKGTSPLNSSAVGQKKETQEPVWVSYSSPNGLFSVLFPTNPDFKTEIERDADGFAVRTNEIYVAEDENKNIYTIYFIRYLSSQIPLPPNTLLNNLMYEILDTQKGSQLLGFRKKNFKGKAGLEFSIEDKGLLIDSLAFIDNNDLYLLSVIGKEQGVKQQDFDRFTNSFVFKNNSR